MKKAFANLKGDLAGTYFPLTGMDEKVRQQLVDDHFLFVSGDPNLKVAGMERDWPKGRGIFHNKEKTFLIWVNEEDQLRIISMQKGGDVKQVFTRLAKGIKAVQDSVKKESGKDFCLDQRFGYIHSCPTNLGTGKRTSSTRRPTSVTSPSLPPSTLLLPSTSPRTSGTNSRTSQPRHLDSPWLRLLLALSLSTTSTAVSMLVTGTHTRTLLQFLIL